MPVARFFSLLLPAFAVVAACATPDPEGKACRNIPDNGCTLESSSACSDATCAAIYECNADGSWSLVSTCPNFKPDAGAEAGANDASFDSAPPPSDGSFPYPVPPGAYGGPGCNDSDLQGTDCPVGTVVGCSRAVDPCCGCETLFVCQNGNWVTWGECFEDGGITASGN